MSRFNGKHVIITKVANGINKADELLDKAMAQDAPIYHHSGDDGDSSSSSTENESIGRQIYKTLNEWCISYASIRCWWRYLNRYCILSRCI